jgi:hypothetical protein
LARAENLQGRAISIVQMFSAGVSKK